MEIYNFKRNFMSSSGSSMLHGMSPIIPMLDLFVRESIQNSFDARLSNAKFVKEEFNCGEFDNNGFTEELEGLSQNSKKRMLLLKNNKFISVRDYNTTGLTGPLTINDIKDNNWGKFLNLVRNFGKSQKEAGAGGSWGYGKTTFYKMGVGLVVYYSRIKQNETYEERLMACIVENEKDKKGLLYDVQYPENTGIAWWGELIDEGNEIIPLKDSNKINKILGYFNLEPYVNDETGTLVIIPYIDEEKLLNNTFKNEETNVPWTYSIEDYLKISFQRWYPTRCDNKQDNYIHIESYVNGRKIDSNNMYPLYKTIQSLYNYHLGIKENLQYEISTMEIEYKVKKLHQNNVGNLYYCLLDEENLKMNPPYNNKSPISQITNDEDTNEIKNIICFCRKPGMILKYDLDGQWANLVKNPDPTKYMICLFVPNSANYFEVDGRQITIEDYLRASESAEHNDWKDINEYTFGEDGLKVDTSKIAIVNFIHKRIKSKFYSLTTTSSQVSNTFIGATLNQKLAALFLPKTGLGPKPVPELPHPPRNEPKKVSNQAKIKIGALKVITNENLGKEFEVFFSKKENSIAIELKINSENKEFSIEEWEEDMEFPVLVNEIKLEEIIYKDGNRTIGNDEIKKEVVIERMISKKDTCYGFKLIANDNVAYVKGTIIYKVIDATIGLIITKGKIE